MEKTIELLIEIPEQSALIIISPPSLQELIRKLAVSINKQDSQISLLYNRKGT